MNRDYVGWYRLKARLNAKSITVHFNEREIWWCSIGANIGSEEDGKSQLHERPVLILKKYNDTLFTGIPLTSVAKLGVFYYHIKTDELDGVAILSQTRALSSQRLQRRIGRISIAMKREVLSQLTRLL